MAESESGKPEETAMFLNETINELKKQLQELSDKKNQTKLKIDDIKSKLKVTREAEHKAEERMKDILKVEAQLEELMSEETRLIREKSVAEDELSVYNKKLAKADALNKKIAGENASRGNTN